MKKKAFTIIELLVVVAIIALLIAILLPALGRARDAALVTQSQGNLRNLAAANATYGADYNDRQFTLASDDYGLAAGNCTTYVNTIGCPAQPILGWDDNGGLWGYWIGGPLCPPLYGNNCGNWIVTFPNEWNFTNGFFGYYRLPNCKPFNTYVNGRFYDRTFVAPKDKLTMERAEEGMGDPGEFTILPNQPGQVVFSTYVWSPAALWNPDVLSRFGFKQPSTLPAGWKCPTVSQAKNSELKTRMIEFYWLQNQDGGPTNPGFAGGYSPWYFNQGYSSNPNALFFDGHVSNISVSEVMDSDRRMQASWVTPPPEKGLWHRGTPLGANGFYENLSFDLLTNTSFHMLTADGIVGRDTIGAK